MTEEELKERWKRLGSRVIQMVESMPHSTSGDVLGKQLVRLATSVAANDPSACKAGTRADIFSRRGTVEEEGAEIQRWIELIGDSGFIKPPRVGELLDEAKPLTAILAAPQITVRGNHPH
jgi:four helix bundle protein